MKKKDLITKGVAGLTVSAIILSSCTSPSVWMDTDEASDSASLFPDEGSQVVNLKISAEDEAYLSFLQKLSEDIVKEPAVAREFAKDPDAFVKQYGYESKVDLDESMLKLILSLGDEDINTAVNQNDITTVIALMESKGLLDDIIGSEVKIRLEDEDIKLIYEKMGINPNSQTIGTKQASGICCVFIGFMAVSITIAAIITHQYISTSSYVTGEGWSHSEADRNINDTVMHYLPLKIFSLKGQDGKTYIAADKYITEQAHKLMTIIKDKYPGSIEHIGEDKLEQILKYSLVNK